MAVILTLTAVVALSAVANAGLPWTYQDFPGWADTSATCGSGKQQSPIAIAGRITATPSLKTTFLKYESVSGDMTNDGRNIVFVANSTQDKKERPQIQLSEGSDKYALDSIIFHWGNISQCQVGKPCAGSEHIIGGKSAPAEAQLIHFNIKYDNASVAETKKDGLAAIAFHLTLVKGKTPDQDWAQALKALPSIKDEGSKSAVTLNLTTLIPKPARGNKGRFFRYTGSLTRPSCAEGVKWTVYADSIEVLSLSNFNQITSKDENNKTSKVVNTFRPVEPLNDRPIRSNKRGNLGNGMPNLLALVLG